MSLASSFAAGWSVLGAKTHPSSTPSVLLSESNEGAEHAHHEADDQQADANA